MEAIHDAHVREAVAHKLRGTSDYASFNYGAHSEIAKSCAAADARRFMACTDFVTELVDVKLARLQDFIAFRLPRACWEG